MDYNEGPDFTEYDEYEAALAAYEEGDGSVTRPPRLVQVGYSRGATSGAGSRHSESIPRTSGEHQPRCTPRPGLLDRPDVRRAADSRERELSLAALVAARPIPHT